MVPKVLPEIETLKAKLERGADLTLGPRIESKFRVVISASVSLSKSLLSFSI